MPRVDDNNKAFPRVIWYFEGRQDTAGEEEETVGKGWIREDEVPFHTGSRLHYSL